MKEKIIEEKRMNMNKEKTRKKKMNDGKYETTQILAKKARKNNE